VRNVCVRERDKCFISAKQLYTRGVASKLPKIITDGPRKGRGIYTRSIRAARIYPRFTLGRPSFLFSDAWIYARTPRAHSPSRKKVTDLSLSLSLYLVASSSYLKLSCERKSEFGKKCRTLRTPFTPGSYRLHVGRPFHVGRYRPI
jgi:hypothetical protein